MSRGRNSSYPERPARPAPKKPGKGKGRPSSEHIAFEAQQFPGVGGAMIGCDCDMCAEYRRAYYAEQEAEQRAEDAERAAKGQKPKRRPKKPKHPNPKVPAATA